MKNIFCALLLLGAAAMIPVGALAAPNETTTTGPDVNVSVEVGADGSDDDPGAVDREWIDNVTAIQSASLNDGRMTLVIYSKITQRLTLTDAGAVLTDGEVPRRTVTVNEGTNRVTVPVTPVSGRAPVTIATRNVLYAKSLESGSTLLTGPWGKQDVQVSALGGLFSGLFVTFVIAYRRVRGVTDEPERML
jgi:hypothetical protein